VEQPPKKNGQPLAAFPFFEADARADGAAGPAAQAAFPAGE